jgi:hypothetical protein
MKAVATIRDRRPNASVPFDIESQPFHSPDDCGTCSLNSNTRREPYREVRDSVETGQTIHVLIPSGPAC